MKRHFFVIATGCTVVFLLAYSTCSLPAAGVNGSGIPGSPKMVKLHELWKPLNASPAKQRGRERFNENKYGMFIHWGLYSQCGGVWKGERMEEGGTGPKVPIEINPAVTSGSYK